jgi:hypothetical protein
MSFCRIVLCVLLSCAGRVLAQTATTPDTITFNDGEQLSGKLVSILGGRWEVQVLFSPSIKKFNFTVSSTDNYLGDPPEGFHRNSFQFTSGVTYVIK